MAAQQCLKEWKPFSNQLYELRQLTRFYQQLQDTRTMLRNQLQTMVSGRLENHQVADGLKSLITETGQQIKQIRLAIEETLKKDTALWEKVRSYKYYQGPGFNQHSDGNRRNRWICFIREISLN
jgi:hypothetical protein